MPDDNVPSLDIDTVPLSAAPDSMDGRRAFRVPVLEFDDYFVKHAGERYPIVNISVDGAGASLHVPQPFSDNELIEDCILCLGNLHKAELEGRIVHCSPVLEGSCWLVGVHWLNLGEADASDISERLRPHRDALFEDDS